MHPLASRIGVEALTHGGTAVDAAVATAFALAVTWPGAGNIGGGGYMMVVPTQGKATPVAVDFREIAPAAATKEMFVTPRRDRRPIDVSACPARSVVWRWRMGVSVGLHGMTW